jgi:hypothetical protein
MFAALALWGGLCPATAAFAEDGDATRISTAQRLTHYDLSTLEASGPLADPARQVLVLSEGIPSRGQPDRLEAESFEMGEDGIVRASGCTLYITSLLTDGAIVASGDQVEYEEESGAIELGGNVAVALEGTGLELSCNYLYFDPLMERIEVEGLGVTLPLALFIEEDRLKGREPSTTFYDHFYSTVPESVQLTAGRAQLDLDERHQEFILSDAKFYHHPHPDPDIFFHADKLRINAGDGVVFQGISFIISGVEVFSWPQISRRFARERRFFSLAFPIIRFEKNVGIAWKQGVKLDFGGAQLDSTLDYSPEYGVLSDFLLQTEVFNGTTIGIESGTRSVFDINRRSIERHADYNMIYRQHVKGDNNWFRRARFSFEYGNLATFSPAQPESGLPAQRQEDTRLYADGYIELPLLELADGWYLATGMDGQYVEYLDNNMEYRVVGGEAGVIWRHNDFDHFVLYRHHRISGQPLFSFDEVREREVDFMTGFSLHPEWRHVVRAIYDVAEEEFDQLQVSALKQQKTFEIGMYWDFARESAGLELGLLVN